MKIRKRDGRIKNFDFTRIIEAVGMATNDVYGDTAINIKPILDDVQIKLEEYNKDIIDIEKVQDIILSVLYKHDRKIHKSYKNYREERNQKRYVSSFINKEIDGIFDCTSEEVRNNANKSGDKIQSHRAMIADVTCKEHARNTVFPKYLMDRHEKTLYIHDLNYASLKNFWNCCLINWIDMLENGCVINGQQIESPKSISTAVALLSQIVAHVSSNCYGGVTLPKLTALKTYAKRSYDKWLQIGLKWLDNNEVKAKEFAWERLEKEVYDSAQGFEYEIQTLTNSRAEIPFLSVEIDCGDEDSVGLDREIERLIIKSFLLIRKGGLSGGKIATFPKILFELREGYNLNPEDRDYDLFQLSVETTATAMYPDYINYDKCVEVTGGYKPCMSCRSFLGEWNDENGNRKTYGRWNSGVVSINLPRLAIMSEKSEEKFYELLHQELEYAKEIHMIRFNRLKGTKAKQAPILYMSGAMLRLNPEDTIDEYLYGGYSSISIGYIGLHNTMMSLYGKSFYEGKDYADKAEKIMKYIHDWCEKTKEETNIGFSMYSTPFEIGATKLCKADQQDFGVIEGVNDKGYYENSFHYPSDTPISPFDKIDIESRYSKIASGGAIQYCENGNLRHNLKALEDLIRYSYDKTHYFAINTPTDTCFKCGYKGEIVSTSETETEYKCPQCGNTDKTKMNVIRRLCGYISALDERSTIDNKLKEINHRVKHLKGDC